ncbi:MAG: LysR family transcriptional regulator [Oleiphilus sp.]|nr:MAG: LysR family transcriptional regulator [Oleiphilus sp.]
MQLSKVDLNLFVVFDVIYRERNLTKASEILHITQPAVSNALARLRQTFDDRLFVRQQGQMIPTPLAENIIERVRFALANLEGSLNEHDDFEPLNSTRRFSFAMNDTSESYLLPLLMTRLEQEAPHINIESYAIPRDELSREFSAGQLDFALDVPLLNEPLLTHQPLTQDRFVCLARKEHPDIKGSLTMTQYLAASHIHISSRRRGQGYIDMTLNRMGQQRKIKLRVQHSRAAPPIVRQTDLLLTIPETLARDTDLQILELPFDLPKLDWHLYWASNYENDNAHRWMRELIFDIFAKNALRPKP